MIGTPFLFVARYSDCGRKFNRTVGTPCPRESQHHVGMCPVVDDAFRLRLKSVPVTRRFRSFRELTLLKVPRGHGVPTVRLLPSTSVGPHDYPAAAHDSICSPLRNAAEQL